jgi:two-component system nitrate/nitrite sensor histidine kinase NarX
MRLALCSRCARTARARAEVRRRPAGRLGEAYADLRELLAQFRSRMDPLGLVHALNGIAAVRGLYRRSRWRSTTACPISTSASTRKPTYSTSCRRRSPTSRVIWRSARLVMEKRGAEYAFSVEDDGSGFFALGGRTGDAGVTANLRHHLGVNIMRERAQRLAGRLEIANLPQGGARVTLVFPALAAQRAAAS